MMLESDSGVFRPTGFGFTGSVGRAGDDPADRDAAPRHSGRSDRPAGGGADIGPSVEAGQLPAMSLEVEGNYFLIHHTPPTPSTRSIRSDMAKASAAIAVMAYVIADMPERLR